MSDKLIDRINALLAKAEATDSEDERDLYNEKASELMVKYGIEQAVLAAARDGRFLPSDPIIKQDRRFKGVYADVDVSMAYWVARALTNDAIRGVRTKHYRSSDRTLNLIGYESDLAHAWIMFDSLRAQRERAAREWWERVRNNPEYKYGGAYTKTLARRQFREAFAVAASDKVREVYRKQKEEAVASNPGTEIALVDRKQQVDSKFKEFYPTTGKSRASGYGRSDYNASSAGRAAGQRADVGGRSLGGGLVGIGR